MSDFEAATEDEPSLRDEISAAIEADASIADAPTLDAPEPVATDRARDEHGRFSKASDTAPDSPEPIAPKAGDEPAETRTIAPPASWSATAKAQFQALDPVIQREVLKREKDIETGKAQWDQKGERLNRLDTVLAPRRERFQLAGFDEVRAIEALFAAQDFLERDPAGGLTYLARQYGVDLGRLAGGAQGQAASEPPMHPALRQLAGEVNSLKGALAQQQSAAEQAVQSRFLSEVEAFSTDPSNPYVDNVREDMIALLQSGRAASLKDAYDKAVWANPETRTLVQQSLEDQRRSAAETAARAKAQAARHASGSITGSPSPGSSPASAGPAPTLRDELARAFSEAS